MQSVRLSKSKLTLKKLLFSESNHIANISSFWQPQKHFIVNYHVDNTFE